MNEVYMFFIVFVGVFVGMMASNLLQGFLSAKRVEKVIKEMEDYAKTMQKTRSSDIEKLDKIINKKRGRRKRNEQRNGEVEQRNVKSNNAIRNKRN